MPLIAVNAVSMETLTAPLLSQRESSLASHSTMAIHEEVAERRPLILPPDGDMHQPEDEEGEGLVVEGYVRRTLTESRKLWRVAGPSIFSRLAMFSLTVVSMAFASHLGSLELAALSIATTVIISFSFGFMLGMASALETLCGQAFGAKSYRMLGIYLQRSWIVLSIFAVLLLPLFIFTGPILKLTGQSEAVADRTGLVALWLIPFHLSFPFQFTLQRFLQCQLKTMVITWVSGCTLALHMLVSWFFVYKLRVGIVGVALTLDFSWWVSTLAMFIYVIGGRCKQTWTGFSSRALDDILQFFKLSIASGFMLLLENVYYRFVIILSGHLHISEITLDGLSICNTIFSWESMIPLGFLAATGVRVANELGAGKAKAARFAVSVSVFNALIVGMIFWLVAIVFSDKLARIFTTSDSVVGAMTQLSTLLAFSILINCIQPVFSGVAVGCGWQALATILNLGSYYVVGLPLGIIFGWLLPFGIKGIWSGLIGGTVVQTLLLGLITLKYDWQEEVKKAKNLALEAGDLAEGMIG